MKISVIAIFYNSAAWVRKCVDSILAQQGHFDLELIAVDDCSPDETLNILQSYGDSRLRIVHHEINRGISSARNSGLEHITGDCFFFIDGDDYLPDGALARLAEYFSDEVDWVQGSYAICDETGKVLSLRNYPDAEYGSHRSIEKNFDQLEFIYTHNRLINSRLKDIRFPIGKAHEDRFWNVEAFPRLQKIICVSSPTYNYIAHSSSFSNKSRASVLYIESAMDLLKHMDAAGRCWEDMADTFMITAIEKNCYLWEFPPAFRKNIRTRLKKRRPIKINIAAFPRFTKHVHNMIAAGMPDMMMGYICTIYRIFMKILNRPV